MAFQNHESQAGCSEIISKSRIVGWPETIQKDVVVAGSWGDIKKNFQFYFFNN
jgi:hypothetical protein